MRVSLSQYLDSYPEALAIFYWSHASSRLCQSGPDTCTLADALRELARRGAPQVLYANCEQATERHTFDALCTLLLRDHTWAVNLGEAEFSAEQCGRLVDVVRRSQVAFMFVESQFVGSGVIRDLKDVIRDRRRAAETAPWLLGEDADQNSIILRCTNMWWSPTSLGRNRRMLQR